VRPLTAASKVVRTGAALAVAAIDELDLHDAFRLALLSKERIDYGAPALTDVVDPVLVDQLFYRDRFALPVKALQ
jgi:hypothetical protein